MSDPTSTPDRGVAQDDASEAERVRQGRIVMRSRAERIIFAAGLGAPVIILLVLWLAHVL